MMTTNQHRVGQRGISQSRLVEVVPEEEIEAKDTSTATILAGMPESL